MCAVPLHVCVVPEKTAFAAIVPPFVIAPLMFPSPEAILLSATSPDIAPFAAIANVIVPLSLGGA